MDDFNSLTLNFVGSSKRHHPALSSSRQRRVQGSRTNTDELRHTERDLEHVHSLCVGPWKVEEISGVRQNHSRSKIEL